MIPLFVSIEKGKTRMIRNPMTHIFHKLASVCRRLLLNEWDAVLQGTGHQEGRINAIESQTVAPGAHPASRMAQKTCKFVSRLTRKDQGFKKPPEKYVLPNPYLEWEKPPP
jgi:hypothetical protein